MNNRWMPRPEINTDCVMNMDDDAFCKSPYFKSLVPLNVLKQAFYLWKKNPDQLIGYKNTARKHIFHLSTSSYTYERYWHELELGNSIVLPYGMFYHRDMLQIYMSKSLEASRGLVDMHNNCDDILLNFAVSNYTGKPPLFIGECHQRLIIRYDRETNETKERSMEETITF